MALRNVISPWAGNAAGTCVNSFYVSVKCYNNFMINWNTDEVKFKKLHPKEYKLWRLTQLINYGLNREKLDAHEVKQAWPKIKDGLDPDKQKVIEFFLWDKKWRK